MSTIANRYETLQVLLLLTVAASVNVGIPLDTGVREHPPSQIPRFSHPPHNVTVVEGGEATLLCGVTPLQGHKMAWVHEDSQSILTVGRQVYAQSQRMTLAADHHRSALTLDPVTAADRGWYMCQLNTDPMTAARAYLQVLVRPVIIGWSGPVVKAREGSGVTLECLVRSHPPATVTWTRGDGAPITVNGGTVWSVEGPRLEISSVGRQQAGMYTCTLDDGNTPPVTRDTMLEVTYSPMLWLVHDMVGGRMGDNTTLQCTSDAFPHPTVYWNKDGNNVSQDGVKYLVDEARTPDLREPKSRRILSLQVLGLDSQDFGSYTCYVGNPQGRADATIELYEMKEQIIQGPPITMEPPMVWHRQVAATATLDSKTIAWDVTGRPDDINADKHRENEPSKTSDKEHSEINFDGGQTKSSTNSNSETNKHFSTFIDVWSEFGASGSQSDLSNCIVVLAAVVGVIVTNLHDQK